MIKHGLSLLLLVLSIVPSLVYGGGGWILDADGRIRAASKTQIRGDQVIKGHNTIEGKSDNVIDTVIKYDTSISTPCIFEFDVKPIQASLANLGGNNEISLEFENNRFFSIDKAKSSHDRKAITNVQVNMNMERMIEACGRVYNYNHQHLDMIEQ